MKFSLPTIQSLFGIDIPTTTDNTPQSGEFLRNLLQLVVSKAKPKGSRTNIGPTNPTSGEKAYAKSSDYKRARSIQFPSKALLPDGRHRFFKQGNKIIDRLKGK